MLPHITTMVTLRIFLISKRQDRGSYSTDWVLGISIAVAIAVIVGAVLKNAFEGAAVDVAELLELGVDQ